MIEFEIVSELSEIETIASGPGVRDRARLQKRYGKGHWRKLKGIAKREFKIKLPFLDS